jgi:hypothetical protein
MAWGCVQAHEHLPSKQDTLNSIPSTTTNKKKKKGKKEKKRKRRKKKILGKYFLLIFSKIA